MYCFIQKYFRDKTVTRDTLLFIVVLVTVYLVSITLILLSLYTEKNHVQHSKLMQGLRKYSTKAVNFSHNLRLVCYYNFPSNESDLQPEQIPESLCTHINIAFARIKNTSYQIQVSEEDLQIISKISSFKLKNKDLKLIISVGGGGNNDFSEMVKNHSDRKMFINSTVRFMKKNKLDGVDIDWEWPAGDGNSKEKIKFVQLLQEFREEFDRHKKKYILSMAAAPLQSQVQIYYYLNYITKYVDYFNLMTYDYHFYTTYYPVTDLNAPLYPSSKDKHALFMNLNINYSVNFWVSQSVPRDKIILGLPAFGHTYRLISSLNHDLHAPANGFGSLGNNGFIKYNEVCDFLSLLDTFQVRDDDAKVPYAYNQYDWVSFDDEESIGIKSEFIIKERLGGAMVYSLNTEDFAGVCKKGRRKFPLVQKIKSIFSSGSKNFL